MTPEITDTVRLAHSEALEQLPFHDTRDFDNADRGFIAARDSGVIHNADGAVVWDNDSYAFLHDDCAPTVHPSLWRQSQLNIRQGLFEVCERIYQVRGFDLSNISFIEGDTGVIVIDPLVSSEPAAAALELYRQHRGDREVRAVIYTHSHVDHFGGVFGVTSQEAVDAGDVAIYAPEGFLEHVISENVYVGPAMARRAAYMYGAALERGPGGQIGAGLGQTTSTGEVGLIPPTVSIAETGERHVIDGVEFEFQMAPGSEAPAEMHFYFPQFRALCMAENATHTLHNLVTLRGALVRDPLAWSNYLTEAIELYADKTDVVFACHHWPTWGNDQIVEFMSLQRDLYAYLHNETLRLINQGYTGIEIAEMFQMPPALENAWHARGYYGSVSHDVKAIYQRYMGWFDGNPARLWPYPPEEISPRYVEAIGGPDRTVALANEAYAAGDFRWAATLLDHVIFTDPTHQAARALYIRTLKQLAYLTENATWRNFFLMGATELKSGNLGTPTTVGGGLMAKVPPAKLFEALAVAVNGPRSWDHDILVDFLFTDRDERYRVMLRNGVMTHRLLSTANSHDSPQATVTTTMVALVGLIQGNAGHGDGGIHIDGDGDQLMLLLGSFDRPDRAFNIIEP